MLKEMEKNSCHGSSAARRVLTSDLRAACKTDRNRRSRGVSGGMLGLRHPVGLVDSLASAKLAVLC